MGAFGALTSPRANLPVRSPPRPARPPSSAASDGTATPGGLLVPVRHPGTRRSPFLQQPGTIRRTWEHASATSRMDTPICATLELSPNVLEKANPVRVQGYKCSVVA